MWSVTFINLQPKRQGLEHRHVPDGHDSQVQGMCAQSGRWQCNNSSSWGQQCPSLWAGGVHDGEGCWLLQWQKLLVSSGDKAARVSLVNHCRVLSCESCSEAMDVARAAEVLSSKDCWGPPQSRPLETPVSPSDG